MLPRSCLNWNGGRRAVRMKHVQVKSQNRSSDMALIDAAKVNISNNVKHKYRFKNYNA